MEETWVQYPGWEDALEKEMASHSSTLAWKIPWMEELSRYSLQGLKESSTTERLHFHFQTMVEVMKIMVTSLKRSHTCTATLTAPNPAACHHRLLPPLEIPGHSWASLGQSLLGSLLLSPGSWCTRFYLCPLRVCFPSPV